jgi:hypothetical protein
MDQNLGLDRKVARPAVIAVDAAHLKIGEHVFLWMKMTDGI